MSEGCKTNYVTIQELKEKDKFLYNTKEVFFVTHPISTNSPVCIYAKGSWGSDLKLYIDDVVQRC